MMSSVGKRGFRVGWLVALSAVGWAALVSGGSASGSTANPSSWSICTSASQAALSALEANLSPSNGATVQAGTPVTFSGSSEAPVTFAIASSAALLSSPDIDSGFETTQAELFSSGPPPSYTYTFTSTKATATPATDYWDASFSDATLAECAGQSPTIYTTPVRTLTVLPPTTEGAAADKPTTEEVAGKSTTEGMVSNNKREEVTTTGSLSLDGSTVTVQSSGGVAVKLACTGAATCAGNLTLTANGTRGDASRRGKKASSTMTTIGNARFSISAGKIAMVKLALNATGSALLKEGHGRLSTNLTILESSRAQTHTETVDLVGQKAATAKKPAR
jgi:hypothetical protein